MEIILACEGIKRNGVELTEEIIKQIEETFKDLNYKPPIVIGHISEYKDGDKAFGRVLSVRTIKLTNGKLCIAGELKITEFLQNLMNNGEYDGFSIGVRFDPETNKAYLHHLAVLGAYPPADQMAGEPLQLSLSEKELKDLTIFEIKLSDNQKGGFKEMDEKKFKELLDKALEEKVKSLNLSTQPEETEVIKIFKKDKKEKILNLANDIGFNEDEKKALERLTNTFQPFIKLSDNQTYSPFDDLEKVLTAFKNKLEETKKKTGLTEPLNLSDTTPQNFDIDDLTRNFTIGGE
jgi:hypothetical protein